MTKPATPFTPTVDADGTPTVCRCCGRHAIGIGRGTKADPGFLCRKCITIVEDLSKMDRLDVYELAALDAGVDAVGAYLSEIGKTDLAECDELDARMIVKAAWLGCAEGLRRALNEAPF
ncbi:hypothetical protein CN093_08780 [Sinorhizobium meliloti]|uniref:DUF6511 domain-containing protein n=1 Tax=Rhizobium meliloti TaxID=382 RepID=UPI000FD20CA2|nr:DUF6511 domain-containing protein [Sinorhizobium meliloti]RVO41348.1 hypothetical protein CN093_08780 [Sinorhizobium meliloti]